MSVDAVPVDTVRLERQLHRERRARLESEQIAEHATRELYESVQALRRSDGEARAAASVVELLQRVATAANEAPSFKNAAAIALAAVCERTGWPVGHLFVAEGSEILVPTDIWHIDDAQRCRRFIEVTNATTLRRSEGLPGRVLATGRPAWIADLSFDPNFPRAREAADIEVQTGFAFPVVVGAEVVAVLEFFAYEQIEPSDALLEVMVNIGAQLGRVVERERAARALLESEQRFRQVIETAHDAFVALDHNDVIVEWNRQAERQFGWSATEAIGRPVADILSPSTAGGGAPLATELFRRDQTGSESGRRSQLQLRSRDGRSFPVEMTSWVVSDGESAHLNAFLHDITERKQFEAQLEHQALHDHLTGLANRALLVDRLGQCLARTDRGAYGPAVLFIDLDGFKLINDSFGHGVGDRLLCTVAQRLSSKLRPTDTLARHAGDEFVAVLDQIDEPRDAAIAAERLADALAEPINLDGESIHISASIGVALAEPDSTPEALLADADSAMYTAKRTGRGRFEIFGEGMRSRASTRLRLENQLRHALENPGELELHYQPVVALDSLEAVGVEALIRWQHPERGLLPPADIIELAEDSGLIVPVGAWVLGEACRQARLWRDELGRENFEIAINLSARQLVQADFVDSVAQILEAAQVDADLIQLCFEITETVLMSDPDTSAGVLKDLQSLGFRLAIDDFGTGYSSLAYLRTFPVDIVKLDRTFITAVASATTDRTIVGAVIDLAHALDLTVVAEGVETDEQLQVLQSLGCDTAQGYLFARPIPPAQLGDLIRGAT